MSDPIDLATCIAERHGFSSHTVRELGGGEVNHSIQVDEIVVRFACDSLNQHSFALEAWCAETAIKSGISTPEHLAWGELEYGEATIAYDIQQFCTGSQAPTAFDTWSTMGSFAAEISALSLASAPDQLFTRFGRDLLPAWQSHVDYNVDALGDADKLVELGVYPRSAAAEWGARFAELRDPEQQLGLCHADLRPPNLIVHEGDSAKLIDWGSAQTGPVAWIELTHAGRQVDLGLAPVAAVDALAEGAGWHNVLSDQPRLTTFDVLWAFDVVRWAIQWRPDLVAEHVEAARRRLEAYQL